MLLEDLDLSSPRFVSNEAMAAYLAQIGIADEQEVKSAVNDLLWKVNLIDIAADNILSIGCGGGMELLFLRERFKEAAIDAIDWIDARRPRVKEVQDMYFRCGNIKSLLKQYRVRYDLVFSNHVLEHMYDPEESLKLIYSTLKPGGYIVAAMPLDGAEDLGFKDEIIRLLKVRHQISASDAFIIDAGHPWKTNVCDLTETLQNCGFRQVRVFQRKSTPTRHSCVKLSQLSRRARLYGRIHSFTFRQIQRMLGTVAGHRGGRYLFRALEAIERRSFFGTNQLKNRYSPEVFVIAQRPVVI
jgi:2-polyprenyl-3-methyl-5-hydroxy-6-metoxy-1,4-benzoquinol methylase